MNIYVQLFLLCAKLGVMTFGGGMAMLPMLQRELVENKHWCTEEELGDYYAIGQCTPGIIAVNTATFIGNKMGGKIGGVIATCGMVFPSLVIISFLASLIEKYSQYQVVKSAFAGIQVAVCVLIINSVVRLAKGSIVDKLTAVIFVAVLLASYFISVTPVVFVLLAAAIGIIAKQREVSKNA